MIAAPGEAVMGYAVLDLIDAQVGGRVEIQVGSGPDSFNIPWSGLVLLLPILVLVAVISSLLPALRAARLEVIEALRYE
jgi:hypothetical protein